MPERRRGAGGGGAAVAARARRGRGGARLAPSGGRAGRDDRRGPQPGRAGACSGRRGVRSAPATASRHGHAEHVVRGAVGAIRTDRAAAEDAGPAELPGGTPRRGRCRSRGRIQLRRRRRRQQERCEPVHTPHVPPPCRKHHSDEVSAGRGETLEHRRSRRIGLGSFKVKLVIYFLLLSLLPIAAAFWGFTRWRGRARPGGSTRGSRPACGRSSRRITTAQRRPARGEEVAPDPVFQARARPRPVESRAPAAAHRATSRSTAVAASRRPPADLLGHPRARWSRVGPRRLRDGRRAVRRGRSSSSLRARVGAPRADSLVILRGGRIVAAVAGVAGGAVSSAPGQTKTVSVGSDELPRARRPGGLRPPSVQLRGGHPQSPIDDRQRILAQPAPGSGCSRRSRSSRSSRTSKGARSSRHAADARGGGARRSRAAGSRSACPVRGRDEFAAARTAFNDMANQLEARLAELERASAAGCGRDRPLRRGARGDARRRRSCCA